MMQPSLEVGRCYKCLYQVSGVQPGYVASSLQEAGACVSNKGKGPISHVAERLYRTASKSSRGL